MRQVPLHPATQRTHAPRPEEPRPQLRSQRRHRGHGRRAGPGFPLPSGQHQRLQHLDATGSDVVTAGATAASAPGRAGIWQSPPSFGFPPALPAACGAGRATGGTAAPPSYRRSGLEGRHGRAAALESRAQGSDLAGIHILTSAGQPVAN